MAKTPVRVRIGIYGLDPNRTDERHGCGLWPAGYAASVTAAEADPVVIGDLDGREWDDVFEGIDGVVVGAIEPTATRLAEAEDLCQWARARGFPLLAIDQGLHVLNTSHGGSLYNDLPRELPEALQHRHPPERGLRHAINILPDTALAGLYGEGEVVVNSEHRRAVLKVARGFQVSAQALDGVIEAIESTGEDWFALGVQWQPASATSSGLDIQLFRGLIDAAVARLDPAEALERCAA